jgi:hypothetical protein
VPKPLFQENAMTKLSLHESQQSDLRPTGTWKLEPGRALTLHPSEAGELRVAQGRLWATLDGPHSGSLLGLGDLVLEPGAPLHLRAGQSVVIEPADHDAPAFFAWELAVQDRVVPVPCWQPVLQSWRELRSGLGLTGHAAAGLVAGLVAVGLASLPRRMPGSRVTA